jgi:hypothetical protein
MGKGFFLILSSQKEKKKKRERKNRDRYWINCPNWQMATVRVCESLNV